MNHDATVAKVDNSNYQTYLTPGSAPMMILAVEPTAVSIAAVNPAFSQLTGYTPDDVLGRPFDFLYDSGRDQDALATLHQALAECRATSAALYAHTSHGVPFLCELQLFPVRNSEGSLDCYRGLLLPQPQPAAETIPSPTPAGETVHRQEPAEQKALAHLQFLHRTALELITLPDEESIYTYIGRELSQLLPPAVVVINKVKDEKHAVTHGIYGLEDSWLARAASLLGYSPIGRVYPRHPQSETYFQHGGLVLFNGTLSSWAGNVVPAKVTSWLQKWAGLNNLYFIGLQKEGELYADIQIYTRCQQTITDTALIEAFVNQASTALQHMQARVAQRRAAANLRAVLGNLWQSFILVDRHYIITDIGDTGKAFVEASVGRSIRAGVDVRTVLPERHLANFEAHFQRALHGEMVMSESSDVDAAGSVRHHRLTYYPIADADGAFLGVCLSHQDITDQKRTETALQRTNRALRVLSQTMRVQRHSSTVTELLRSTCELIVAEGDYQLAWAGAVAHDAAQSIRPLAHGGMPDGYLEALQVTWSDALRGQGPVGTAVRTGKPAVVRQIRTDPAFAPWRDAAVSRGYESCVGLPIFVAGAVWGVLVIYAGIPDAFDMAEVRLLQDLADDLGSGIDALHTQMERDRAVAALRDSETSYRLLAQNAPDVIYHIRLLPEMAFEYVSPAVTEMIGYTPEDHYANPNLGYELVHPEDRHMLETATREAPTEPIVLRYVRKDGTVIWTEQRNVPVFDDAGNIVAIEGIARDITRRKEVEMQLRDSRQQMEMALQGTQAGTWEWHIPSGETVFNERWAEIIGYTLAELAPISIQTWTDYTHPDDMRKSDTLLQKHFAGELDYYECECRMKHKDGHWVWVLDRGRVMEWSTSGDPLRMFGTHVDISARKEAEAALRASEAHYRLLTENAIDLVAKLTPEGVFTYASPAAQTIFGYSPEALLWRTAFSSIHPDDIERVATSLQQIMHAPDAMNLSFRVRHQQGYYVWVETNSRLIVDAETGEPVELHVVARDVTARRQTEGFLQSILDSSMNGIITLRAVRDVDNIIVDFEMVRVNRQIEEIIGQPQEALFGRRLLVAPPDMHGVHLFDQFVHVVETGEPEQHEHLTERDGQQIWYQITAVKLDDGLVVTLTDVTARKEAEQRRVALALVEERSQLLAAFIEKTAHEFRTPLSVISVNGFLMQRITDVQKRHEKGTIIEAQVQRLARLVDLMLEMVKLDSEVTLAHVPVDVSALVTDLCAELTYHHDPGPTLQHHAPEGLPPVVGDSRYLKLALHQLLHNASRFTPPDGEVEVGVSAAAGWVCVEIRDTGMGIADADMANIFDYFWRKDTMHSTPGLGLGLPLAKHVIARHSGTIEVESETGVGSLFRVMLPAAGSGGDTSADFPAIT